MYGQAISHGKLGRLYLEAHELDKAKQHLEIDRQLCVQMQDLRNQAVALIFLADVCLRRAEGNAETFGSLTRAGGFLAAAKTLAEQMPAPTTLAIVNIGMARRLVLEAELLDAQHDAHAIEQAAAYARRAKKLLHTGPHRAEWIEYARVWHGWVVAKGALTLDELRDADRHYFSRAVANLEDAQLPVMAAEASFQRARMLLREGRRLGHPTRRKLWSVFTMQLTKLTPPARVPWLTDISTLPENLPRMFGLQP